MQRIEWVKRLADFIEQTLPSVCSIDELSHYIGISKAHMQRQFKLATGLSIGHYIGHRRLSRAAIEIASTDKRIIDVAMDYDFESQEAFGRAFRKLFGITPKNLKNHPALALNLSTLPLTIKYLTLYPKIAAIVPKRVTIEPLQLHGVMQNYKSYQVDSRAQFNEKLANMWGRFDLITKNWPRQKRRLFTVECRNACSVDNGDFTMMAMCTGKNEQHKDLVSFTLPQREMLCFRLTSNADVTEFLTYLYSVYLPTHNQHINQMPTLWESFENGNLACNISVAQWQNMTPPKALISLSETPFQLPKLQGNITHQQIPFIKQQTFQRLEYLFDVWATHLDDLTLQDNHGKVILIGDALDKPFTPEFEFHSQLLTVNAQPMNLQLPTASYLRASLRGTLIEIAEAIESIKYCALPDLPFYSVHGYEIILQVTTLANERYAMQLLLPIKKR